MGTINYNLSVNTAVKVGINKSWNKIHAGNKYMSSLVRCNYTQGMFVLNSLGTPGAILISNNSAITTLKVGFASGNYPIHILPGGGTLIPLAPETTTLYYATPDKDRVIGKFEVSEAPGKIVTIDAMDGRPYAHGLVANKIVRVTTTGTLPAGLLINTDYFVQSSTPTEIYVSAEPNGALVEILDAGTGVHTISEVFPVYATYLALQA